jgi:cytochrome c biogenesis protein CcdA
MLSQFFFIITLSLFDSFSTTQQIVVFILILTTVNPVRNSLAYLAGLSAAYMGCGILGFMALDKLNAFVARFFINPTGVSDIMYYQTQIFMGVVFAVIGVFYYIKKKNSTKPEVENVIIKRLKNMNTFIAFTIGAFISVSGFPLSLPYIAALGKFAVLKMAMPEVISCLILYNICYAMPMIVIFFIYISAAGDKENIEDRLHEKARLINLKLTSAMFVGMGLLSIADALFYFISGHPMLKNRYF